MLKDFDTTPDDPAELKVANKLLADEVKALTLKVEQLQHQLHGHNRHRFGSKSESADQINLTFEEDEQIAEAAEKPAQSVFQSLEEDDKPARQHSRKSPLARAIRYALGRLPKARPYLSNGHLEADTDVAEQPFVQFFCGFGGFGGFSRQASTIFA